MRRAQRLFDGPAQAGVFKVIQGGLGGAAFGGDARAQGGGVLGILLQHACGANAGLAGQRHRRFGAQAQRNAGVAHGFNQQEEISRAGAGHGGDGVQILLALQPAHRTTGRQDVFRRLAGRWRRVTGSVESADAGAVQGRGVGHAAHVMQVFTQAVLQRLQAHAGGDGNDGASRRWRKL